ncbi:phage tail protein [Pseudomonas sp. NPDC087697]|uniref:phage tail protein n=1 Tax=Pseudomonas sp. NPDC087697 TaxID=3364447 RepID=UPI003800F8C9
MALETFNWQIEKGAAGEIKQRVRTKQFGDGYGQTVSDGINNKMQSWPISHTGGKARIKEIMAFLDRQQGAKAFLWTPPLGELGLYKCNGYQPTHKGGNAYTLTATFEQTFHP